MEINNSLIKPNSQLRMLARQQLRGNWGMALLLCLIFGAISGIPGFIPAIGTILSLLIAGPLTLGLIACFMKLVRNEPFQFENLFDGFKNFANSLLLYILVSLFVFLWSLLLLIPGIIGMVFFYLYTVGLNSYSEPNAVLIFLLTIVSIAFSIPGMIAYYRYAMAFYILYDNPEIKAMDAIKQSKEMMVGFKGKLFGLHLSFIGWSLLCILSLGIGFLWLVPYINASQANFYQNLKEVFNPNPPTIKEPVFTEY